MDKEKRRELALRETSGLILNRKEKTGFIIGDDIRITITEIETDQVKVLIDAPKDKNVVRTEIVLSDDNT